MFRLFPACVLAGALFVSGCESTLRGQPDVAYAPGQRPSLEAVVFSERLSEASIKTALKAQTKSSRDQVVFARIAEIDALYHAYETGILTESRTTDFLLSVGTLGAGLLGGFTTGFTSQVYSLIGGGFGAVQTSYDKEVLAESTIQAFMSQMRANRAQVRAEIFERLRADAASYPIEAALGDLQRYRQAGTLAAAIVGLSEQAQKAEQEQSDDARKKGKELFMARLPDSIVDQEVIKGLVDFVNGGEANVNRYIAAASARGISIDASVNPLLSAVTEISKPENIEENRAIAAELNLT